MDHLGVLDLRNGKEATSKSPDISFSPAAPAPIDLSVSKRKVFRKAATFDEDYTRRDIRPSVITPNSQFTPGHRTRWNHRSHPSIDSDSSFESEQESDYSPSGTWYSSKAGDAIGINITALRCNNIESFSRRERRSSCDLPDFAQTDTDIDSEACDSSSTLSSGFYKQLPSLTENVSIGQSKKSSMILELSSCQAEVIDLEDVQSELINNEEKQDSIETEEDSDEINESSLQICETETYFEELLNIQADQSKTTTKLTYSVTAGIQETAVKYIREIRKTKSDMYSCGLNLEMDGNKKQYCMKCNDEFYSIAALLKHLMTHSSRNPGEKLIKCPVCTKRFSTLTTLENHILRLHTGEMKFVCEICEAPYKYSTHLRKHMLTSRCGRNAKKSSK